MSVLQGLMHILGFVAALLKMHVAAELVWSVKCRIWVCKADIVLLTTCCPSPHSGELRSVLLLGWVMLQPTTRSN